MEIKWYSGSHRLNATRTLCRFLLRLSVVKELSGMKISTTLLILHLVRQWTISRDQKFWLRIRSCKRTLRFQIRSRLIELTSFMFTKKLQILRVWSSESEQYLLSQWIKFNLYIYTVILKSIWIVKGLPSYM